MSADRYAALRALCATYIDSDGPTNNVWVHYDDTNSETS